MRLLIVIATLCACGAGGMQQVRLSGQCRDADASCARRAPLAPIAIGARFYPDVSTDLSGTSTPNLLLESSNRKVIDIQGGALVGVGPGTSAVLISTDDGSIVDFLHVWVAPVTSITLTRRDGERVTDSLGLVVGEDLSLVPSLFHGAQRLAGQAEVSWSVDDEAALAILRDGSSDRRRLRAQAPGQTTIRVTLGDAVTEVAVEVVP